MATKSVQTFTARSIVEAAVKTWGIALQGLQVRTIVRTTDRVPRLRDEPASGNRSHVYQPAEAVMVVDGLTARSSMAHHSADALIRALGIPNTVRDAARAAYTKSHGGKSTASAPTKATKATKATRPVNRALGERAVRVKPAPTPEAPSA